MTGNSLKMCTEANQPTTKHGQSFHALYDIKEFRELTVSREYINLDEA